MANILVFCAPWHIGKSPSAQDIFINPLNPYHNIEVRAWDEQMELPKPQLDSKIASVVFWQVEPPQNWLQTLSERIVWVPMWDAVCGWPMARWQQFPKNLKVVAFSKHVARCAEAASLPTFYCQFFADPANCPETRWEGERVAFYWNRRGIVGAEFLRKFCEAAKVDRLLYRDEVDPIAEAESCRCPLPSRLGKTIVELLPWIESRSAYNKSLNRAHIFIAPRDSEGVGIAFLEMMARGCAVVAFDAATMNEYIVPGVNGVLLPNFGGHWVGKLSTRLGRKTRTFMATLGNKPAPRWTLISDTQDWRQLAKMDFSRMGRCARSDHIEGFSLWQKSINGLARFVAN